MFREHNRYIQAASKQNESPDVKFNFMCSVNCLSYYCCGAQYTEHSKMNFTFGVLFPVRHPRCVAQSYRYKQYTVKHNSMIVVRRISYIVSFNDMFRL